MSEEILLNKIVVICVTFLVYDMTSYVIRCQKLIHTLGKDLYLTQHILL